MKWLHDNGYQTLTPKEASLMLTQDKKPSEKCVLITFDDGYTDNYQDAYPVLKKYGMKATIFMIGKSIGHKHHLTEEQMKEMAQHGISIESHTIDHLELNGLTPQQQQSEMADSKKLFDNMFHQQTTIISYPVGRYNEETLKAAEKTGYQMGVTTEPGAAERPGNVCPPSCARVPRHVRLGFWCVHRINEIKKAAFNRRPSAATAGIAETSVTAASIMV